jgi:hypothetical protein
MAIVSALEYNTFFRGLKASHTRLSNDTMDRILHVLKRSMWLEELHLEGLGFKSEFIHKLAISVISNPNPALKSIDLNHNLIEDKGITEPYHLIFVSLRVVTNFLFIIIVLFIHTNLSKTGLRCSIILCPYWKISTRFDYRHVMLHLSLSFVCWKISHGHWEKK